MRSHDRGVSESKKPTSALCEVSKCQSSFVVLHLHWSRVADGLSELTRDLVLGRKVDLLKQLRGDGQAARGLDLPQRIIGIMVVIEMIACNDVSTSSLDIQLSLGTYYSRSLSRVVRPRESYLDRDSLPTS